MRRCAQSLLRSTSTTATTATIKSAIPTAIQTATALLRPLRAFSTAAVRTIHITRYPAVTHFGTVMEKPELLEGLLAVNKPSGISSGEAIRKLVTLFSGSTIFAETLAYERSKRALESGRQKKRRRGPHSQRAEVKVGHGGTLDPMASGVLVIGIGAGTKQLERFLLGTKTYEATALFGCDTDSYDAMGAVVHRAPHAHLTKEVVEKALAGFRGQIMQKPPIFSALHHEGKRYYEYAREGKPLPVEIKARPVATEVLEMLEFGRDHAYVFPEKEVSDEQRLEADALEGKVETAEAVVEEGEAKVETAETATETAATGEKRSRSDSPAPSDPEAKKAKPDPTTTETTETSAEVATEPITEPTTTSADAQNPPIARLLMSVTKGFYVRSLVYDLGIACESAAHMVKLVRTQQGQWELGKNVFEWEELMGEGVTEAGEGGWGPKVEGVLRAWGRERAEEAAKKGGK
ncbi:pseudouridine synthase [Geopyxis carbonaria]|nr:pseudouridine synthase [Geopyxis carbonaria]